MARTPMTPYALLVLRALAQSPGREVYGFEIMRAASLAGGTVYPLLARLEAAGLVSSRAEKIIARDEGRPARKYFAVTPAGVAAVREAAEREAAALAALGVADAAPEPGPLSIGGFGTGITAGDRQPPGIVSVISRGGEVTRVRSFALAPEPEPERPRGKGPCEHRRPPGSYCTRCGRLI